MLGDLAGQLDTDAEEGVVAEYAGKVEVAVVSGQFLARREGRREPPARSLARELKAVAGVGHRFHAAQELLEPGHVGDGHGDALPDESTLPVLLDGGALRQVLHLAEELVGGFTGERQQGLVDGHQHAHRAGAVVLDAERQLDADAAGERDGAGREQQRGPE
ncbi:MAG: hypothetical protein OXC94_10515 [Chloroflexi bacterium]|nr:hypothetical protein [Chloroflexota bacterium]